MATPQEARKLSGPWTRISAGFFSTVDSYSHWERCIVGSHFEHRWWSCLVYTLILVHKSFSKARNKGSCCFPLHWRPSGLLFCNLLCKTVWCDRQFKVSLDLFFVQCYSAHSLKSLVSSTSDSMIFFIYSAQQQCHQLLQLCNYFQSARRLWWEFQIFFLIFDLDCGEVRISKSVHCFFFCEVVVVSNWEAFSYRMSLKLPLCNQRSGCYI